MFFFVFCVVVVLSMWCYSSYCCEVLFVWGRKTYLISRRYQIMVASMLKNWSCRYSNHYFIKFVGFMSFYYVINLNIVSSLFVS